MIKKVSSCAFSTHPLFVEIALNYVLNGMIMIESMFRKIVVSFPSFKAQHYQMFEMVAEILSFALRCGLMST